MAVEFSAGLFEGKLPFDGGAGGVALRHAGGHVGGEFFQGGNALVQALAGDGREFELDHVEPGGVFGRVVHLEARGQGAGLGGGQVLVEDGVGMGVQVVLHEHDFLRPRVGGGQALQKAAVVRARAPGRDLDQALAGAGLESGQQAGRALAHVRAALPPGAARLGRLLPACRLRGDGRQRLDRLAVEHTGPLVEADHRKARVVGPLVDGQHVFHAGDKGGVHRPQAPVLLAVGRQFVFLST